MQTMRGSLLATVLLLLGVAYAQKEDSKKPGDKPAPAKVKGILPPNFKKLGLRDDQVQAIYKVRADYKTKMDELLARIQQLRTEEKSAVEKVLTPEQLKRLRELQTGTKSN